MNSMMSLVSTSFDSFLSIMKWIGILILVVVGVLLATGLLLFVYDRYIQKRNIIKTNFPVVGRFRYLFHELRPFFRQYFGDDNSWVPRVIVDWILNVSHGKTGYFSFDKFDTTGHLHDGEHQMVHAGQPLNMDEIKPEYPKVGPGRKHPFEMKSFFYRSAMSLGSIGFEGTYAMSAACADKGVAFNTGEGALSVHHLPRVKFSYDRKFFKYKKVPKILKPLYWLMPGRRMKNHFIDFFGWLVCEKGLRDVYWFDQDEFVFYTINWDAPLSAFPKPGELTEEFGNIILQVGSGLYGLRKRTKDGSIHFDPERFQKTVSFCRAVEIKLAQGAKQTGGILKAKKNTPAIAYIRGVHPGVELVSQNRFPFYPKGGEKEFLEFTEKLSELAGGKPVGAKIVISDEKNIEPLAQAIAELPKGKGIDFITIDGGDGGSATAPIALGVLFGKTVYHALPIVMDVLNKHQIRDRLKVFASSKLYAPHMSARAMAMGADAIGIARGLMVAGGCIRAGLCSGEKGDCPVGLATLVKSKRRGYAQVIKRKIYHISNYIEAHTHGLEQVAAICGVTSPSMLNESHIMKPERQHH